MKDWLLHAFLPIRRINQETAIIVRVVVVLYYYLDLRQSDLPKVNLPEKNKKK